MSHPSRVRELKHIYQLRSIYSRIRSHPSRVRELKLELKISLIGGKEVAPLPGA